MMKTTTAIFAAACLTLAACGKGTVTTGPRRLGPTRVDGPMPVNSDPAEAALAFVEVNRDQIGGLSLDDEFAVRTTALGADGLYHIRLDQLHRDVPVWGADIVVHLSDVEALFLAGNVARRLEGIDVEASISDEEALAVGHGAYSLQVKDPTAELDFQRESVRRVLFAGPDERMRLAWHVSFFTEAQAGARPGLWNYLVEADRGAIITWFNGIDTLSQASGPGGNDKVARTWANALEVEQSGSVYVMDTARLRTTDMNHSTSGSGTVVSGPLDPIGDAPINDAHGFAEVTLNMLADWMGHDSIDDNGFVIVSRVHYGSSYENAFWDGTQMTYGDGASTFFPLSGDVDVVAHEINHGFTTFHSNLTYSGMSGGLNESFSDIAGTIAEFYIEGDAADWDLGRDIFRSDGALRYMCDPPQDGSSIGHADDYYSGIDVHFSSGVSNKAFCLAARRLASGGPTGVATSASVERAGTAWYAANASYWTASTDFTQGCQGVLDAARALGFEETELIALRDSWVDVGVHCDGAVDPTVCDETLAAEGGTFTSPGYPGNYPNNVEYRWCIQPASGSAATLTFNAFDTESGYDFVEITDGDGAVLSNTSGTTAPPAATAALLVVKLTSDGSVTRPGFEAAWSAGSNPNQLPSVTITTPANGATVSGDIVISATASDSDGSIARVIFSLPDGTVVGDTTSPYLVTWDSTTVQDGTALIAATAYDDDGAASSQATVTVAVANVPGCVDKTFVATDVPIAIPDNAAAGITSLVTVNDAGTIASLRLSLGITHAYRSDLRVVLTSPLGTSYTVQDRTGGSADDLVINNLLVTTFAGTRAQGTWTLAVQDLAGLDTGTLDGWSITIQGDCAGEAGWSGSAAPNMPTVDDGTACTSLTVASSGDASEALVDLQGTHDWGSVLRTTLEHGGVVRIVFDTGTFPAGYGTFTLADQAVSGFTGDAAGSWTLCVVDTDGYGDTGVLDTWSVHN